MASFRWFIGDNYDEEVFGRLLLFLLTAGFFLGFALSVPLWLSHRSYPLVGFIPAFPSGFDAVYATLTFAMLFCACVVRRWERLVALFLCLLLVLLLQDQTRWQPWVTQYALMLLALILPMGKEKRLGLLRVMLVAMYVWTGLQKMNAGYIGSVVPWFFSPFAPPSPLLPLLALGSIAVEIGTGFFLAFTKTRRIGVVLAVLLHLCILMLLGPIGHSWNHVVWPWNGVLIVLAPLLFWHWKGSIHFFPLMKSHVLAAVFVVLVAVMPALSFVGLWDSYLSFSLYSGNTDQLFLSLPRSEAQRVPTTIPWVPLGSGSYVQIGLDQWALRSLGVPSYPEERVYRAIARQLCASSREFIFTFSHKQTLLQRRYSQQLGCEAL